MAARGVSVLKFVGTVSLGVLTGLSYTLSSLTIPALLTLPSASTAARAFDALSTTASRHLSSLTTVSSSAFALAYILSPRPLRHPYLLYASVLVGASQLAASDLLAPYLLRLGPASPSSSSSPAAKKQKQKQKTERAAARARMEASYEVLGSGLDAHSEGAASGEEMDSEAEVNGEEVRVEVEAFLKKQIMRSAVAGLGFILSVVGVWGDGVAPVYGQAVVIGV
ncbi:Autophagy-related protein 33 [Madurella mycetomatis]|uniref:Autophagy-related protein 33 n=1 Tax=Madurella mycetomatis TaxID=100816 RepID=A0A175VTX2_9PEZI|nr:Autophagy-related protein 33 [Madurella mycetomatis]